MLEHGGLSERVLYNSRSIAYERLSCDMVLLINVALSSILCACLKSFYSAAVACLVQRSDIGANYRDMKTILVVPRFIPVDCLSLCQKERLSAPYSSCTHIKCCLSGRA